MFYCKGSYSVNVSVFRLVEKELGYEKKCAPKEGLYYYYFFRCKLVKFGKLGRVYTSLPCVNSVKLVKPFDFTKNQIYLQVNTILIPKNINSVNSKS